VSEEFRGDGVSKILVIEDDAGIRANILDLFEAEGFEGIGACDGESGVTLAVQQLPDLIICDIAMPGINGYEVFEILSMQAATAVIPFIFLSARAERADIRRGMTLGADDYLTKPFTRTELLDSIHARLRRTRVRGRSEAPGAPVPSLPPEPDSSERPWSADGVVVRDAAMRGLFAQIDKVAKSPISVLILGETGVGKEIVAEQLHRASGRKGRFIALNCAALTESLIESELFGFEKGAFTGALRSKEGLFESAEGGTLFLDEVGDLPLGTQVKLLRVLEERKVMRVGGLSARSVDVRFVAATHRDIEKEAEGGAFRQDLYFRLSGVTLNVPPLRQRQADIAPLLELFIAGSCKALNRVQRPRASTETLSLLQQYSWPGNIRELRNVMERAVLLCDGPTLEPGHLPPKLSIPASPSAAPAQPGTAQSDALAHDPRARLLGALEQVERQRVVDALAHCAGNQTQAAEMLGISRRTLVTRLAMYELPRPRKK
jgi:two-component system, NtrC family, response regulator AtoC